MKTIIDSSVINHGVPVWSNKITQAEGTRPLTNEERLTKLDTGEPAKLAMYTGFMGPMDYTPSRVARRSTGIRADNVLLNVGTKRSVTDRRHSSAGVFNNYGVISGRAVLNTKDTSDTVDHGNVHVSWYYRWHGQWGRPKIDGLQVQLATHAPYYKPVGLNPGGTVAILLRFLRIGGPPMSISLMLQLYVVSLNPRASAVEKMRHVDPNTKFLAFKGRVGPDTKYITMLPGSRSTGVVRTSPNRQHPLEDNFAFMLTDEKFQTVLNEAQDHYTDFVGKPKNWKLSGIGVQFELADDDSREDDFGELAWGWSDFRVKVPSKATMLEKVIEAGVQQIANLKAALSRSENLRIGLRSENLCYAAEIKRRDEADPPPPAPTLTTEHEFNLGWFASPNTGEPVGVRTDRTTGWIKQDSTGWYDLPFGEYSGPALPDPEE